MLWVWYFATTNEVPVFLAAGLIDCVVVAAMVAVARHAHAALNGGSR